jgi:hypothetical protein
MNPGTFAFPVACCREHKFEKSVTALLGHSRANGNPDFFRFFLDPGYLLPPGDDVFILTPVPYSL